MKGTTPPGMDPTYTGAFRKSLLPVIGGKNSGNLVIGFPEELKLRLGGRLGHREKTLSSFTDTHNIGRSRFESKGSVLLANIDAVLNLTHHIGGYVANGTDAGNVGFYSLLVEDHNLEMYEYIQWRRPLSVARMLMTRTITRHHLATAQLDVINHTDVPLMISTKPCDGYQIIGQIFHDTGDPARGIGSFTLKDLVKILLLSLPLIDRTEGKGFVAFPFPPNKEISGNLSRDSVIDLTVLAGIMFHDIWIFRPYMCNDMVCLAFSKPREDPPEGSADEQKLLALWNALDMTSNVAIPKPPKVRPEIIRLAELDQIPPPPEQPRLVLEGGDKIFTRLFNGVDLHLQEGYAEVIDKVITVLATGETPEMTRDRVEVLSRWQLQDSIETCNYPF